MKYFLYSSLIALGIYLFCDNDNKRGNYDKGYAAAWEGEDAPTSFWISKEEKDGYEDGLDDAWTYDVGYEDGYEKRRPQFFNDVLYMDAYKHGKEDREKRW